MPPDWNRLRSFGLVARHGAIAKAASHSHASEPTLSRHVRELEAELGVTLVTRSRSGMVLTDAGAAIYAKVKAMHEAALDIATIADGRTAQLEGVVRISASKNIARKLLPEAIAAILRDHPGLEIELVASDEADNLLERDADIAIRMFRPTQQDLIAKSLGELAMGVFAAPDYLARRGTPSSVAEILDHDVVGYDRQIMTLRGFREAGIPVDRRFFRFRCDDEAIAWELVRHGYGLGFAALLFVDDVDGVVRVFPEVAIRSLPLWLVCHPELRNAPRFRLVFDRLAEAVAKKVRGMRP